MDKFFTQINGKVKKNEIKEDVYLRNYMIIINE